MEEVEFTKLNDISSAMRESLRALRTNILFCGDDVKVIMFTSTFPDEGKSTIVIDLARLMGEYGKKVFVIDADIRKSVILKEFAVRRRNHSQIFGLSYYLSGQKKLEESIYKTNLRNVDIIFSGRSVPNSTELLGKKYFIDLIDYGRRNYEYVLIDCVPVTAAIDGVLVAHNCDGAVIVIEQGRVSRGAVIDVKRQLESSGVRILGAVLNKVRMDGSRYGRYYGKYYGSYYGRYYGHYGSSDSGKSNYDRGVDLSASMSAGISSVGDSMGGISNAADGEDPAVGDSMGEISSAADGEDPAVGDSMGEISSAADR